MQYGKFLHPGVLQDEVLQHSLRCASALNNSACSWAAPSCHAGGELLALGQCKIGHVLSLCGQSPEVFVALPSAWHPPLTIRFR
jgi:hypothetical protein